MRRAPSERLRQTLGEILDDIALARSVVAGMDQELFAVDRRTVYAVIRALENISDAASRLPDEVAGRYPALPWVALRAAGSVYRHDDENVLNARVWAIVTQTLPFLEAAITAELRRLPPGPG